MPLSPEHLGPMPSATLSKCGKPGHRAELCGIRCPKCSKLGHTAERCRSAPTQTPSTPPQQPCVLLHLLREEQPRRSKLGPVRPRLQATQDQAGCEVSAGKLGSCQDALPGPRGRQRAGVLADDDMENHNENDNGGFVTFPFRNNELSISIGAVSTQACIDSGADLNVISANFLDRLSVQHRNKFKPKTSKIFCANGSTALVLGQATLPVHIVDRFPSHSM